MKLTAERIDEYLAGSLSDAQVVALELWLQKHPADAAKVERQRALSAALAASAPELSAARSQQMWSNIKVRVKAERAGLPVIVSVVAEPWYAFLFRPWAGAGLVTACLALAVLVWRPWTVAPQTPQAEPVPQAAAKAAAAPVASNDVQREAAKASAPVREADLVSADTAVAKRSVAAPAATTLAALPAVADAASASSEPTEVERALADSGVDGMIDSYLAAQRRSMSGSNVAAMNRPSLGGGGASLAGFTENVGPAPEEALDSKELTAAQGGQDNNGFWNWTPAALALNRHDWTQAKLELDAARLKAAESSERDFAASALTLLSAPGAPLAGQGDSLPSLGELRVLGAGRWQLLVDSRLARFSEGVSARLPGFRADGDSLLLDLTFDRGTFAPGTHFTRVSGEAPAEVQDAQGQAFSSDEFTAPSGATYNISGRKLQLR